MERKGRTDWILLTKEGEFVTIFTVYEEETERRAMGEKTTYDVVVIGAGNGGLTAALRLAKSKKKVLLLEQHNLPGGFATSFIRGRFEFEASLHELCDLGHVGKHGELYQVFDELGILDKLEFVDVPEAYRAITLDTDEDYVMPFGVESFIRQMELYVPGSRSSVQVFFELAKECQDALNYTSSMRGKPDVRVLKRDYANFMRVAAYPVDKVLNAIHMPRKAQEILNVYWSYLGTAEDELGFVHYALMVYLYISLGAQIPKNRSHEISTALAEAVLENGGDIWYNEEVTGILTDNGAVRGVKLKSGRTVYTEHVVSNASPHTVYGKMVAPYEIPMQQKKLANARTLAGRGVSMFLGLNRSKEELGLVDYSYFVYHTLDTKEEFKRMQSLENDSQVTVCLNAALPDCSPKGTTILYFTSLYFSDCFEKAVTEKNYFRLKEEMALRYISAFERAAGVKLREHIEEIEIGTPLTYAHYTGAPEGSIYGYYTAGWDNMMPRLRTMYTEADLKGLRFCGGHAARSSGYNSAYISGDIAAKLTMMDIEEEK